MKAGWREYVHWGLEPRLRLVHRPLGLQARDRARRARSLRGPGADPRRTGGGPWASRIGVIVENNERRNDALSAFIQTRWVAGPSA